MFLGADKSNICCEVALCPKKFMQGNNQTKGIRDEVLCLLRFDCSTRFGFWSFAYLIEGLIQITVGV